VACATLDNYTRQKKANFHLFESIFPGGRFIAAARISLLARNRDAGRDAIYLDQRPLRRVGEKLQNVRSGIMSKSMFNCFRARGGGRTLTDTDRLAMRSPPSEQKFPLNRNPAKNCSVKKDAASFGGGSRQPAPVISHQ
jgi:hypothetical protein